MADVNDEFDRLLTTIDVDDVADDIDKAGQYIEWFTANALKIEEFEHRALGFENAVILRNLWARFGRAQYTLMRYALLQKKTDDIYNTTDNIHNMRLVSHYIVRDRNYIHKEN